MLIPQEPVAEGHKHSSSKEGFPERIKSRKSIIITLRESVVISLQAQGQQLIPSVHLNSQMGKFCFDIFGVDKFALVQGLLPKFPKTEVPLITLFAVNMKQNHIYKQPRFSQVVWRMPLIPGLGRQEDL